MMSRAGVAELDDDNFEQRVPLAASEVRRRVDDWLTRIDDLYREIRDWGEKNGWPSIEVGFVLMDEQVMKEARMGRREQPALRLDGDGGRYALFKPKGLWVVGANGRIDLYTSKGVFVVVDEAQVFDPPRWTIYRSEGRREGRLFEVALIPDLA